MHQKLSLSFFNTIVTITMGELSLEEIEKISASWEMVKENELENGREFFLQ